MCIFCFCCRSSHVSCGFGTAHFFILQSCTNEFQTFFPFKLPKNHKYNKGLVSVNSIINVIVSIIIHWQIKSWYFMLKMIINTQYITNLSLRLGYEALLWTIKPVNQTQPNGFFCESGIKIKTTSDMTPTIFGPNFRNNCTIISILFL